MDDPQALVLAALNAALLLLSIGLGHRAAADLGRRRALAGSRPITLFAIAVAVSGGAYLALLGLVSGGQQLTPGVAGFVHGSASPTQTLAQVGVAALALAAYAWVYTSLAAPAPTMAEQEVLREEGASDCAECGRPVRPGAAFCSYCGAEMAPAKPGNPGTQPPAGS
ncbi:MAG: zinc ribbon domain-containing protein [Candidatus Dormibacteria bacterium]